MSTYKNAAFDPPVLHPSLQSSGPSPTLASLQTDCCLLHVWTDGCGENLIRVSADPQERTCERSLRSFMWLRASFRMMCWPWCFQTDKESVWDDGVSKIKKENNWVSGLSFSNNNTQNCKKQISRFQTVKIKREMCKKHISGGKAACQCGETPFLWCERLREEKNSI